jgi:hypothetical protein
MLNANQAFRYWVQYRTDAPQYVAYAASMGYSVGQLNAIHSARNAAAKGGSSHAYQGNQ